MIGFLSQHWVQEALGVPVNYTEATDAIQRAFYTTGDLARPGFLEDLAYILDSGIKVTLLYGDRDYACNWIGGEAVSLAVPYSNQQQFKNAGYADIKVNESYVGGLVRQYGNFSFARIFQAGHEVPAYQPETAYEIFRRSMNNLDIATGNISTVGKVSNGKISTKGRLDVIYSTTGHSDTLSFRHAPPPPRAPECYLLAPATCSDDEIDMILNGTAILHNYILTGRQDDSDSSELKPRPKPKKSSAASTKRSRCRTLTGFITCLAAMRVF
jgi:Serine carboxypeptidase